MLKFCGFEENYEAPMFFLISVTNFFVSRPLSANLRFSVSSSCKIIVLSVFSSPLAEYPILFYVNQLVVTVVKHF